MRFARPARVLLATAGSASLLGCFPFHSVTIGRDPGPGPGGPPVVREDPGHGPPPWAPAHGYRRNRQRAYLVRKETVDLVFDSGLGVYVVVGIPNHYYWNGMYLRLSGDRWSQARYLDARWDPCSEDALPGKLARRDDGDNDDQGRGKHKDKHEHPGKGHGHGHGRGYGAAKNDD